MGCLQKKKKNNLSFAGCNGQMTACTSRYHFYGKPCSPDRSIQTHERDAHEQKESFGFQNRAHAFTTNGFSEHGGHTSRNCSEPDTLSERTSTLKAHAWQVGAPSKDGLCSAPGCTPSPKGQERTKSADNNIQSELPPTANSHAKVRRQARKGANPHRQLKFLPERVSRYNRRNP